MPIIDISGIPEGLTIPVTGQLKNTLRNGIADIDDLGLQPEQIKVRLLAELPHTADSDVLFTEIKYLFDYPQRTTEICQCMADRVCWILADFIEETGIRHNSVEVALTMHSQDPESVRKNAFAAWTRVLPEPFEDLVVKMENNLHLNLGRPSHVKDEIITKRGRRLRQIVLWMIMNKEISISRTRLAKGFAFRKQVSLPIFDEDLCVYKDEWLIFNCLAPLIGQ